MIEFRGEIDGRCKKYRLYVESMVGLVCTLIPALLIAFAITICLIVIDWVFVLAYIPLVLFVVFAVIAPLSKKAQKVFSHNFQGVTFAETIDQMVIYFFNI